MAKPIRPSDLPILTDTVGGTPLELPTLTETLGGLSDVADRPAHLSDAQCRLLAEQLFPRLEAELLDALSSSPNASWETAMRQIRSNLPGLIRDALKKSR